jgi:FKBP-type peptidyl-prolyl cis-trans isomerase 2
MIPGFDAGVVGMKLAEEKTLVLAPEDAYGPATIRESVAITELRGFVGPEFEIAIGATIPTAGGDATIVEIQD